MSDDDMTTDHPKISSIIYLDAYMGNINTEVSGLGLSLPEPKDLNIQDNSEADGTLVANESVFLEPEGNRGADQELPFLQITQNMRCSNPPTFISK
jgi:hypothetical protein